MSEAYNSLWFRILILRHSAPIFISAMDKVPIWPRLIVILILFKMHHFTSYNCDLHVSIVTVYCSMRVIELSNKIPHFCNLAKINRKIYHHTTYTYNFDKLLSFLVLHSFSSNYIDWKKWKKKISHKLELRCVWLGKLDFVLLCNTFWIHFFLFWFWFNLNRVLFILLLVHECSTALWTSSTWNLLIIQIAIIWTYVLYLQQTFSQFSLHG